MAGLDPRVLQGQQRSFEATAQLLLAKRQAEAALKQKVQASELKALTELATDDSLPLSFRAQVGERVAMNLRGGKPRETGEPLTAESLRAQQQQTLGDESLQQFIKNASEDPVFRRQALDILFGQRGQEELTFLTPPKQKAEITKLEEETLKQKALTDSAKALSEKRRSGVTLDAARIKKLEADTKKLEKDKDGKPVSEANKIKAFLAAAIRELDSLTFTVQGFPQTIKGNEKRVAELRKGIQDATEKLKEIGGLSTKQQKAAVDAIITLRTLFRKGAISREEARERLNKMVESGVPQEFIKKKMGF